ncbi:hypothetical protein HNY73_017856 [Argiope bruennichi]|uniref:Uncharacterized protein n=1 Tax=Argiope bruennichi TaxID=94029 RepID=A0A8T0ECE7_ARGBR|nr:hypothetical protein HNY73_017856 [Argiope bruennichi]
MWHATDVVFVSLYYGNLRDVLAGFVSLQRLWQRVWGAGTFAFQKGSFQTSIWRQGKGLPVEEERLPPSSPPRSTAPSHAPRRCSSFPVLCQDPHPDLRATKTEYLISDISLKGPDMMDWNCCSDEEAMTGSQWTAWRHGVGGSPSSSSGSPPLPPKSKENLPLKQKYQRL